MQIYNLRIRQIYSTFVFLQKFYCKNLYGYAKNKLYMGIAFLNIFILLLIPK